LTIAEELVRDRAERRLAEARSAGGTAAKLVGRFDGEASFEDLVGASPAINLVYQKIRDVAKSDVTVLIEGETGTGKELVARAIHACSQRAGRPFIAVNCAGLTESLLGSQLFGHKRGAFTGAAESHQGFFEAATGGTIFLDEIGDVTGPMQTALLRVLQEKEVTRIGETSPRKVDVRVLAATHHNLSQDVVAGRFRADLLYRLRVARIQLPPLRERREDIPLLAASFLVACRGAIGQPVRDVSNQAMRLLADYAWPGNVRELRSAIESATVGCRGTVIEAADLPAEIAQSSGQSSFSKMQSGDERERIMAALAEANGNRTVAAKLLGVSRATFYRRLADLNISPDS
jgi:DNA-binding NtrC family response regulator